jgi:pimeloyl-ACP methyl ester carboxylesterase
MASTDPADDDFVYDEFAYLHENAGEYGLAPDPAPEVARTAVGLSDGRALSALIWGSGPPEVVFVHGTGQNAHTWDTVVLALGRPAVAVDLPGHGHSDWRDDRAYDPHNLADDVAVGVERLAPDAALVVGMSLGGLVSNALAARHAHLVRGLLVVDVTPGVTAEKAKHIHDFIEGPPDFPSFTEILARTVEYNPTRTEASLRRGIVHNAERRPDGSWRWRYDRRGRGEDAPPFDRAHLKHDVAAIDPGVRYVLARGGADGSVVDDGDVAELVDLRPGAEVVTVAGAGHSIQGDRPLELTSLIEDVLAGRPVTDR